MTWRIERPGTRPRRAWAFDALVSLLAVAFGIAVTAASGHLLAVAIVESAVVGLVLLFRRVYPVPVFVAAFAAAAVTALFHFTQPGAIAVLLALHTVAVLRPRREALIAAGCAELGTLVPLLSLTGSNLYAALISITALVAAATGLGLYRNTRRTYLLELTDRAARLERERDQQAALATVSPFSGKQIERNATAAYRGPMNRPVQGGDESPHSMSECWSANRVAEKSISKAQLTCSTAHRTRNTHTLR